MVLGTYSCQILSSSWFFTGWIDSFLKFFRASWTHTRWVTENFWVWFYTWMATFGSIANVKAYREQLQGFPGQKGCWILSLLASKQHGRVLSSILSGYKYSLISPQTHDAFFHFLLPFYKMEKWRWEAVVTSSLEKNHHRSFWELLVHLRD